MAQYVLAENISKQSHNAKPLKDDVTNDCHM